MSVDEALKYIISMGVVPPPSRPRGSARRGAARRTALGIPLRPAQACEPNTAARSPRASRPDRHALRLGAPPARPRRRDLHRPARPRRPGAGGLRSGPRRDVRAPPSGCATSSSLRVTGKVRRRPEGTVNPDLASGEVEVLAHEIEILNPSLTPPFQIDDEQPAEKRAARVPLPRPAAPADAAQPAAAPPRGDGGAALPRRARLHRHRDADALQVDARRRARLPGALARAPRPVLRAAAVAAALQADADGRGLRPLLPDRQVLPRRGPARRPPARVHADRHRDLVPRRGRDPRADGRLVRSVFKEVLGVDAARTRSRA